ncbi:MAG: chain length determinant protein EpsF [Rubrivivax sp.]|nr:MAG: chain length determinant protein EpsF [Rubrivivax sp.]
MTFSQLLIILVSRWKIAAIILTLAVASALTANFFLPKKYTATAAVVLDVRNPDPIQGGGLGPAGTSYMATQMDIITSEQVARRVVDMLKLEQSPFRDQWFQDTEGKGDFRSWAAQALQLGLEVKPSRDSNVISISYTSTDPVFASVLANNFVKAYTEVTLALRTNPARESNVFFDVRAKEAKQRLADAQEKLSTFQREHNLISTAEQFDDETAKLNTMAATMVSLRAQSADTNSRSAQVARRGDQIADVVNNPVVAGLRGDLARLEARLQEMNSRYGENHPDVVQLRANIGEIQKKISQESSRTSNSVVLSNTISQARDAEVQAAYDAQRRKVLRLKEDRDTAAILQREMETSQTIYDGILARIAQSDLESRTTLTNVAPLTSAVAPTTASSPKSFLNIIMAIVLGGIVSIITIVVSEMLDRRVRTPSDVSIDLGYPLLGVMPSGAKLRPGAFLTLEGLTKRALPSASRKSLALSHNTNR